jgi:hypothetical protein
MPSQDSVTRAVDALSKSDVKSEAEKTPNLGDVDDLKALAASPNAKKTRTRRPWQEKSTCPDLTPTPNCPPQLQPNYSTYTDLGAVRARGRAHAPSCDARANRAPTPTPTPPAIRTNTN